MMRILKFLIVFSSLILYILAAALLRLCLCLAKTPTRIKAVNRLTYLLMHVFRFIGGFKITVGGEKDILKRQGLYIISTHVGYIDGLILGTLVPGSYTTKSEIRKVPVLGLVVSLGESIFIDRNRKSQVVHYINDVTERLKAGINVFNFPEGHASDGTHILPFFKAFFDAPLKAKAPIVPVSIEYTKLDGNSDYDRGNVYCADGKQSIISHLWNLMRFRTLEIAVTVHQPIEPNGHGANASARKELNDLCMQRLAGHKNLPIADVNPLQTRRLTPEPVEVAGKK
jgi:1-acyl-sn-glycerol-3-phosphate acyltransferase